jgi:hypothetical protein
MTYLNTQAGLPERPVRAIASLGKKPMRCKTRELSLSL